MPPCSTLESRQQPNEKSLRVGLAEIKDQGRIIWQNQLTKTGSIYVLASLRLVFSAVITVKITKIEISAVFFLLPWSFELYGYRIGEADRKAMGCGPPQGLKRELLQSSGGDRSLRGWSERTVRRRGQGLQECRASDELGPQWCLWKTQRKNKIPSHFISFHPSAVAGHFWNAESLRAGNQRAVGLCL